MTETGGPYTILPAECHRSADPPRPRAPALGGPAGLGRRHAHHGHRRRRSPAARRRRDRGARRRRHAGLLEPARRRRARPSATAGCAPATCGFVDEDGYLFIVDRLKDMIVSGGENVYSAEVENALARHPAIASCAVIGIPSERWGEQVHAVVVLRAGAETNIEQLREHCRGFIAGYKCPVSVEFRDALPLSARRQAVEARTARALLGRQGPQRRLTSPRRETTPRSTPRAVSLAQKLHPLDVAADAADQPALVERAHEAVLDQRQIRAFDDRAAPATRRRRRAARAPPRRRPRD